VFISYAREDQRRALRLYRKLQSIGANPWIDEEDLKPGSDWQEAINEAIQGSRFFLALLSMVSIDKRGYLQQELKAALEVRNKMPERNIYLIPVRLDECQPKDPELKNIHFADLFDNWERGFKKLEYAIRTEPDVNLAPLKVTGSITPEEYFNDILPIILDFRRVDASKIKGTILFRVHEKDVSEWTIVFDENQQYVVAGSPSYADLAIDIGRRSMIDIIDGKFHAQQAMEDGDVKLVGELELLKTVGIFFIGSTNDRPAFNPVIDPDLIA
jgi:hypothetical protein